MAFPQHKGKHAHAPLFTPEFVVSQSRSPGTRVPPNIIISYYPWVGRWIARTQRVKQMGLTWSPSFSYVLPGGKIGVAGGFGIGAPAAGTFLEELIARGAKRVISIGSAGGLQHAMEIGDFVICDKAIRDEGYSHHYAPHSKYAYPDMALTSRLEQAFKERGDNYRKGTAWTIDAPFRETIKEISNYRREGVLSVEMEASALFTMCKTRRIPIASAFVTSDILGEKRWKSGFQAQRYKYNMLELYKIAVATLQKTA